MSKTPLWVFRGKFSAETVIVTIVHFVLLPFQVKADLEFVPRKIWRMG